MSGLKASFRVFLHSLSGLGFPAAAALRSIMLQIKPRVKKGNDVMDDESQKKDFQSIKEFAKLAGMSESKLRYYDRMGVFIPAKRGSEFDNNHLEIGNKEIKTLFGERSSATISRLKKAVKSEMNKQGMYSHSANKVSTVVAFQTWGIDVNDLEKRKQKIEALNL
jgi:DNA-binding transcriptional MerR regulator